MVQKLLCKKCCLLCGFCCEFLPQTVKFSFTVYKLSCNKILFKIFILINIENSTIQNVFRILKWFSNALRFIFFLGTINLTYTKIFTWLNHLYFLYKQFFLLFLLNFAALIHYGKNVLYFTIVPSLTFDISITFEII